MDDDDDAMIYGTPLPEYEDEPTLRKKLARDQEVCDEKGRRRFHGAFTGGFSAGYFNTVGTKEGWTPSAFISSKNRTADRLHQNPEDFMDDEDFGEFGIATKRIHTTSNFQDSAGDNKGKRKFVSSDAAIPGEAPLRGLVCPINDSIGIKILKKMGWRLGQGIGPRVKKQSAEVKVYGCSFIPSDNTVEDEEDPTSLMFTFAPQDADSVTYEPKDDCFGLGYSGLSKKSILDAPIDLFSPTSTSSFLKKDKKKLRISGQAFGVGAFEDEDADIYSKDDMSQYDFSDLARPMLKDSHNIRVHNAQGSKKDEQYPNAVLEGFCLASNPAITKKYYKPPELPKNFNPVHISTTKSNLPQTKRHQGLTADCRSIIIGENKFRPADVKSLEKPSVVVLNASNKFASPAFIPFSNTGEKQKRYEQFLKVKDTGDIQKLEKPPSMTDWEHQQELEEFSKASTFFKPLSLGLSLRFESRSQLDVEHEVMSALQKIKSEKAETAEVVVRKAVGSSSRKVFVWHPTSLLCKRFNVPNPFPNSDCSGVPHSQKLKTSLFSHISSTAVDVNERATLDPIPENKIDSFKVPEQFSLAKNINIDVEKSVIPEESALSIPVDAIPTPRTSNSERTRPPMDLFKDIFENSSSDEEIEESENENNPIEKPNTQVLASEKVESNFKSDQAIPKMDCEISKPPAISKRVGFGVFANLDLDALSQRTPVNKKAWEGNVQSTCANKEESLQEDSVNHIIDISDEPSDAVEDNNYYGPELPPDFSVKCDQQPKSDVKKHNKHKVKHKHKHHKHKSEKKKKKKRSKKDSESEDFSDSEDIPPSLIIEKLKKLKKSNESYLDYD